MKSNEFYKNQIILILALMFWNSVLASSVFTQEKSAPKDGSSDTQRDKNVPTNFLDQLEHFFKSSSTKTEKDEDDKDKAIVAIRHLNLIVAATDDNGNFIKKKLPYIEIELFSRVSPTATNPAHLVQIGDQEFYLTGKDCEENFGCIMVVITPEQFANIKENALVTYRIGNPNNSKALKEAYKNGEPDMIGGAKFGRIKKSLINKSPTVERNNVSQ